MTVVREFHIAVDQPWNDHPVIPSAADVQRRIRLIKEEFEEVLEELVSLLAAANRGARLPEVLEIHRRLLKELADLRYVTDGTAVEFGLPIDDAFLAVHASNMTKRFRDGRFHKDPGGKVLKGEDYQPADMEPLVPSPTDVIFLSESSVHVDRPARTVAFAAGRGVTFKT